MIDIRERFGRRVRYLRRLRKWTQEMLAERAQLTGKYIGQVERAEVCPSLRVLDQLADALGIPLHELLHLSEHEGKSQEVIHTQLSNHEVSRVREVLAILQRLFS